MKSVVLNLLELVIKRQGMEMCEKQRGKSKWLTSCWTETMGPNVIFVHLVMIHMHTEFCSCKCM